MAAPHPHPLHSTTLQQRHRYWRTPIPCAPLCTDAEWFPSQTSPSICSCTRPYSIRRRSQGSLQTGTQSSLTLMGSLMLLRQVRHVLFATSSVHVALHDSQMHIHANPFTHTLSVQLPALQSSTHTDTHPHTQIYKHRGAPTPTPTDTHAMFFLGGKSRFIVCSWIATTFIPHPPFLCLGNAGRSEDSDSKQDTETTALLEKLMVEDRSDDSEEVDSSPEDGYVLLGVCGVITFLILWLCGFLPHHHLLT